MKNITSLLTLGLILYMFQTHAQLRITKVNTNNGEVTIKNFGGGTIDISSYRLCARQNYTNSGISALPASGTLSLTNGSDVTVTWSTLINPIFKATSDLGLYLPSGSFALAATMVDFTQWGGTASPGRESVAVTKGIWDVGDFIPVPNPYFAYVYTGNGTQNKLLFWTDEGTLSIEDNAFSKELKIYPNPSSNQFSIQSSSKIDTIKIITLTGQIVKTIQENLTSIDVSGLSTGLYLVEFNSKNKKGIKRLVIL